MPRPEPRFPQALLFILERESKWKTAAVQELPGPAEGRGNSFIQAVNEMSFAIVITDRQGELSVWHLGPGVALFKMWHLG